MHTVNEIKNIYQERKRNLFNSFNSFSDSLKFSMEYSLLIEEWIRKIAADKKYSFSITSAGSFSRRELSPYSDIDIMIVCKNIEGNESDIANLIQSLWDNGLEVSHTVRDFDDISRHLLTDLHTFTQFFETRYLAGNEITYNKWHKILFEAINNDVKNKILLQLFDDLKLRYEKYGDSPKVLEPNVKMSPGGLRDFQAIEWMFMLKNKTWINSQFESTQAEVFIDLLKQYDYTNNNECNRLLNSYKFVLAIRNHLHLINDQKTDRFEFSSQVKLARIYGFEEDQLVAFMQQYFRAAGVIYRFAKSMIKKFEEEISHPISDSLIIELDEDFIIKGGIISVRDKTSLMLPEILRAFYYRGLRGARFDEKLRTMIVETVEDFNEYSRPGTESSVFFREILKLPKRVGQTLSVMNELGVLGIFLPEFGDLVGFLQHGVYHCYTADEHTLITIRNVGKLRKRNDLLGKIFNELENRELLYLALLFHDIAKPINLSGHEIIGAEMAASIMYRLGYSEKEIDKVVFLVRNHLMMEQVAFRRDLNDPETLNNFTSHFNSVEDLNLLYLVTYADLSAVNPAVWTSWKSELLSELYRKSKAMLEEKISGEELLYTATYVAPKDISKHSEEISETHVENHINSINNLTYTYQFTDEEIAKHIEEIEKGINVSVLFKELTDFTNITVIAKDYPSLLSKLCGVLAINDANIHDAKIFTRKDGIVIDTFNVTDFRTHKKIDKEKYNKIKNDFNSVIAGLLQLSREVASMKSKWWRIESKFFKRTGQVKIVFEKHEKFTIIDVFSPDRLGFLYLVTSKMNELGLIIYFAKISTRGDDIVDSFYVLNRDGNKISQNDYELIKSELTNTIEKIL